MRPTEITDVQTGAGRWMQLLHAVVFGAAMLATVFSTTTLLLKFLLIAALALTFVVVRFRLSALHTPGRLRFFGDGLAWLSDLQTDEEVILLNHAWVSRWICVIPCRQLSNGKRRDLMVCASDNEPDDYRRLLTVLRLATPTGKQEGIYRG